jgi:hypothetical protein
MANKAAAAAVVSIYLQQGDVMGCLYFTQDFAKIYGSLGLGKGAYGVPSHGLSASP